MFEKDYHTRKSSLMTSRMTNKGNRGVEPIIASLLMLVITVAAFSIVYGVTNSWISTQRSGTLTQIQERLTIEDFWFKTGGYICVYIRNTGTVEATINQMQVNGTTYSYTPSSLTLTPSGSSSGGWMNATIAWTAGRTYEIKITTDNGSAITTNAKS